MEERIDVAILAAGAPPAHEVPLGILRGAAWLIACDGAWRTALALGCRPDEVVGDGDSLDADDRAELARRGIPLTVVPEQDTNDLCKAFRRALLSGDARRIAILGATGLREDHALGNIFHLTGLAESCQTEKRDVILSMVTNYGVFEPLMPPGREWRSVRAGMPVSIFAPLPGTEMSSEGLVWPLDGVALDELWRGTLNRTAGDCFSLRTNRPALVYVPHEV